LLIIESTVSIPNKFCTEIIQIKTTKSPSWVVQIRASQIQDGGDRHFEKSKKMATSQQRCDRLP